MASPQEAVQVEVQPVIVAPLRKRARIKGTWTMIFGAEVHDFVDGNTYEISSDLFEYLRQHGNIYDTMA